MITDTESDDVYRALVSELAHSVLPTTIMGITVAGIGFFSALSLGSMVAGVAAAVGSCASFAKIALILLHYRRNRQGPVDGCETRRWERWYAAVTLVVALSIAVLATTTFRYADQTMQMLGTALTFGYASGVVSRLSIRPRIASAALAVAVVPTALAAAFVDDVPHAIVATMFFVFLAGGFESVRFTHCSAVRQIRLRLDLGRLARRDALTGLANRIGLRDAFDAAVARQGTICIHCLDLDGFKPVNDRYGHAVGDTLLCAVADRLRSIAPGGATVARTGGDEFVIVQRCSVHAAEAGSLADDVVRVLAEPHRIAGHDIRVGASLGHANAPAASADLDTLLGLADAACYRAKERSASRRSPTARTAIAPTSPPRLAPYGNAAARNAVH